MTLKTWGSGGWETKLSQSTTVCIADDDVGAGEKPKPWWIYLAQVGDPPVVRTSLPGRHLLLSQEEAQALVVYLLNAGLLGVDENAVFLESEREEAEVAARLNAMKKARARARKKARARTKRQGVRT